jgi:hypothetical protein
MNKCATNEAERNHPMNNIDLVDQMLGIEKLHVIGSDLVGAVQINLYVESRLTVASFPDRGHISEQDYYLSEIRMIWDFPIAERHYYLSYLARRFK